MSQQDSDQTPPDDPLSGGFGQIEVVELTDIDLDMAVEAAMQPVLTTPDVKYEPVDLDILAGLRFFEEVDLEACRDLLSTGQIITMGPGYVLLPAGQLNNRVFFVLEGQLRLHPESADNKPFGIIDVGLSAGLDCAISGKPNADYLVAAEHTQVLALELDVILALNKRNHAASRNYTELLTIYLKGHSFIPIGLQGSGSVHGTGFIDELTGLHNNRWLEKMLPRYVSRCTVSQLPLSMLMFEIDKLTELAEKRGTDLVEKCVSTIGHLIFDHARVTDLAVRDGDNRFIVLMPESDLDAARELARRIKDIAGRTVIPTSEIHKLPPMTLSMGIAQLEGLLTDLEFMEKTEKLLQQAKNVGGNWLAE